MKLLCSGLLINLEQKYDTIYSSKQNTTIYADLKTLYYNKLYFVLFAFTYHHSPVLKNLHTLLMFASMVN